MEVVRQDERKLAREKQIKIIGMLAEIRDKADRENLRSKISYKTCREGLKPGRVIEWSDEMIKRLEELRDIAKDC